MSKSKDSPAAGVGHNSDLVQFQDQVFLESLVAIKAKDSEIAAKSGELSGIYDRLKKCEWTKADIAWAKELQTKDAGEIVTTMERRLRIAKLLGHSVSRQFDMFDKDRAPIEDVAYEEGFADGAQRKPESGRYDLSTSAGQKYQAGHNDGTAFINKDLASQFESEDGDILIPGSADEDDEPVEETLENEE